MLGRFLKYACFLILLFVFLCRMVSAQVSIPLERQAFYYMQALANYEHNWKRLERQNGELWPTFGVRRPADYLFAQTAVEVFLRKNPQFRTDYAQNQVFPMERLGEIVRMIREMQELSPDAPFRGNFFWYWRQKKVEDRNAVEFVIQRLLYCWVYREFLPEVIHQPIREILQDAAPECVRRKMNPEYTNIAVLNLANLILLGEVLNKPEVSEEGIRRLNRFLFWTWNHGICEFGTPVYFTTVLETLEELRLLTKNVEVRQKAKVLLDYWRLVISLTFQSDGRLAGAYSRTYNYLYGDEYLVFHLGTWGWCELPKDRSNITILTALALNDPEYETSELPHWEKERTILETWGKHWKTTFLTEDFAVGTASDAYGSHQDQLWTVDWRKKGAEDVNPRCFFVADGRGDPWGMIREETNGGHQKSFHLDPKWSAEQFHAQTLCRVEYPKEMIQNFQRSNPNSSLRSVFVLKRPDEYRFLNPQIWAGRYGTHWLVLTLESVPDAEIASELIPSPDGNAVAWCVTHDLEAESVQNAGSGLIFTSQIVDSPDSLPNHLEFPPQSLPEEILTVNGEKIGRAFLEKRLPTLAEYAKSEVKATPLTPKISVKNAHYWRDFTEGDAVLIQAPTDFRLNVSQPGKYKMSARLLAPDPQHDSLQVTYWTGNPPQETHFPCWAVNSSQDWRTVEFRVPDDRNSPVILNLPQGEFLLRLSPREYDVRVKELFFEFIPE